MRKRPVFSEDPFGKARITQVGADLYRIRLQKRSLLNWFSKKGDVTVTEDGRVIFPGWMLPAVRSLHAGKRKCPRIRVEQMKLFEDG